MIEDVITLLDQLGVDYDEDYETELLTISITDVDKSGVVEIISTLLTNGLEFDITDTDITVTLSDDDVTWRKSMSTMLKDGRIRT